LAGFRRGRPGSRPRDPGAPRHVIFEVWIPANSFELVRKPTGTDCFDFDDLNPIAERLSTSSGASSGAVPPAFTFPAAFLGGPSDFAAPAFAFAVAFPAAFLGGPSGSAAPASAFAFAFPAAFLGGPSAFAAPAFVFVFAFLAAFLGGSLGAAAPSSCAFAPACPAISSYSPVLAMGVSRPDDCFAVCVGDGVFSSARAPEGSGVAIVVGESSIMVPHFAFGVVGVRWPGGTESGEAFIDT
jgi:hypothetical protein